MMKIHLDTDIGGDMDDLCALAMLLKWPDLEITGVTTVSESGGRRAGYVEYVLKLMGRGDIPFAAGADVSGGYYAHYEIGYPPDEVNWPEPVSRRPGSLDDTLALLKQSIEQGATVVGIGPYTNLMLLDKRYPGILKQADLVLMGGYIRDMPPGYPQWRNDDDYNIQADVQSAHSVLTQADPVIVPLAVSVQTALCQSHLPRLTEAGRLGKLLVHQAAYFARTEQFAQKYGTTCSGVPDDIINFHHDPLACAIALGWREGVTVETIPLKFEIREGWLYETPASDGMPRRVVTQVDGSAFNAFWCSLVCR